MFFRGKPAATVRHSSTVIAQISDSHDPIVLSKAFHLAPAVQIPYLSFFDNFRSLSPPAGMGSRICPTTHCACRKRGIKQFGTISGRRGCSNLSPPRDGVMRMEKVRAPWWEPMPGLSKDAISMPVVGPNIALYAVPAHRASTYILSSFSAHSTSFSPISSIPNGGMCLK